MVKLTIENEELKKEFNSRFVFAVIGDPEGDGDAEVVLLGQANPKEIAEHVGNAIGTQFKFLTDKTSSRIRLCEILTQKTLMALIGDDVEVKKVETNIEEV